MIICKNCNSQYEGNYCNNCGQTAKTYNIDFDFFKQDISSNILKINTGFIYTLKALSKKGGHFIYNYVIGKRMNYSTPISFLLFVIFLLVLVSEYIKTYNLFTDFTFTSDNQVANEIYNWLLKNTSYFMLIIIPLYAFSSWIIFYKYKYNYFVHWLLNTYIIGFMMLVFLIVSVFGIWIEPQYIKNIELLLLIMGLSIFYAQFFKIPFWKTILLVLMQLGLMIIIIFLILFIFSKFTN